MPTSIPTLDIGAPSNSLLLMDEQQGLQQEFTDRDLIYRILIYKCLEVEAPPRRRDKRRRLPDSINI